MENKKILIVEDDEVFLNALRDRLSAESFEVLGAKNGKDGLDLALKSHPDIILLDILMPVMGGLEMITELRKDKWGKDVKVVILTNLNNDSKIADFLEKGAYDYFIKADLSLNEVVKRVKERLTDKN